MKISLKDMGVVLVTIVAIAALLFGFRVHQLVSNHLKLVDALVEIVEKSTPPQPPK